ncbi:TPA: ABC transporter permease, partial [Streptococcus agalactiae]
MMNPLGWTYLTFPFTDNNWFPLIFALIFSIIVVFIAFSLEGGRDMGAGYLPQREGRESAKQSLLSVRGLFININKGVIISWLIAYVVMGAAYGSIYGDMQTFLESNEMMKQMFSHTGFSIEESFTGTVMMVLIGLVSILPIAIVNKLFSEERRLHLSQIYATKVTRSQLYWTSIGLSILSGLLGVLLAAGSLGGTAISAMGNSGEMDIVDFFAAGFNLFPTVLFFIGLAALALGWAPKLGKIVYIYLTFSFLLNYFSGLIDLPEWFLNTAIQSWMPQMPMDDFEASVFLTVTIISIALIVIGFLGYSRRDMNEGA